MRIGFDVDGVLARFTTAYQQLVVDVAGVDLFEPGDATDPPCWNWPEYRGYDKNTIDKVWGHIKGSHDFWMSLSELPDCCTLRTLILDLQRWHDIYFVTSRVGRDVKWQTEQWLRLHLQMDLPTVLMSSEKGLVAKALKLDVYVDDNADNVNDVIRRTTPTQNFVPAMYCIENPTFVEAPHPDTRTYLIDKSYNREPGVPEEPVSVDSRVVRVATLGQMFDRELNNL